MKHLPRDIWLRENARARAVRQARIVEILSGGGFIRGDDLARALSVSKRTVYRDVEEMKDVGEPIGGAAGLGYALMPRRAAMAAAMRQPQERSHGH